MNHQSAHAPDVVTLEEVHRLLSDTEFVSAKDLVPNLDLGELDLRILEESTEPTQAPVEPGAPTLPRRR